MRCGFGEDGRGKKRVGLGGEDGDLGFQEEGVGEDELQERFFYFILFYLYIYIYIFFLRVSYYFNNIVLIL